MDSTYQSPPQAAQPMHVRRRRRPAWQRNLLKYWPPIRLGLIGLIFILLLLLIITLIFV